MAYLDEMITSHEAILRVRFLTKREGGRKLPVSSPHGFFTCTLFADGDETGYDVRLLLAELSLELGETYDVPAIFLSPSLALPKFQLDTAFRIVDGKTVGRGIVARLRDAP
jgi:hypothetical protein